ncbi:hypothetical protein MKK67_19500 [Methylobacterium sp. J-072]|uniref:hypothetical protein n=1 Tax=Methylobacterium sp. J-072 TaxID=2836651 RepID=UPI001FBA49FC|nr:hypothetical protein [Methylobacterium sp. J-072]MCJ2094663.1 hypothetical protein [Methylobacterium sp. J-072]
MAGIEAEAQAARQPGDPVWTIPGGHAVRLEPGPMQRLLDEGEKWCRKHVDHKAGHLWAWRIDTSANHDELPAAPMFIFSDWYEAFWFKMRVG